MELDIAQNIAGLQARTGVPVKFNRRMLVPDGRLNPSSLCEGYITPSELLKDSKTMGRNDPSVEAIVVIQKL